MPKWGLSLEVACIEAQTRMFFSSNSFTESSISSFIQIRFPVAMTLARMTRADLRGMALDDLFTLLQWIVAEISDRLSVRNAESVRVWVREDGAPATPSPPRPEPESEAPP